MSLDFGGMIVDTPGLREFGLWGMEKDRLASLFPDMRGHIGRCKFGPGCTHSHEPGCAIKEAAASGEIDERRQDSYVRLLKSL